MASLLLVLGNVVIFQYNFYLHDTGHPALLSTLKNYELCVVMQLVAAVCGIVAIRRGSWWWALTTAPAILQAVGCYFSEL